MKKLALVFTVCMFGGCIGGGTLGGFQGRTFFTSKRNLVRAIDTLFSRYPEYKIPDKWKYKDQWKANGYGFLDWRVFYFKSAPEEVYYVTFYGDANDSVQADTTNTTIAIRAVDSENDQEREGGI